MVALYNYFFDWMPPILFYAMSAMIALFAAILVFKIIAFILDIIPFA